jgi:hypothetical protein
MYTASKNRENRRDYLKRTFSSLAFDDTSDQLKVHVLRPPLIQIMKVYSHILCTQHCRVTHFNDELSSLRRASQLGKKTNGEYS